jgi:hypothetical protein
MRRLAPLALLFLVAGCDGFNGEEQRLFQDTAYFSPSDGVTSDDWRVGPFFGARVQVIDRDQATASVEGASPNPARPNGEVVVQVYADEGPGGFALYSRQPDGGLDLIQAVNGVSGPNIYTFSFFGSEASATGASGSYRLVVLDGLGRVVTYGDLVLQ